MAWNGLLGMGGLSGGGMPAGLLKNPVLSQLFDPTAMRNYQIKRGLMSAGAAMMNPDPNAPPSGVGGVIGRAAAGGMQGAQQAENDFYNRGIQNYGLLEMQREQDSRDAQQAAMDKLIPTLPPEIQGFARAYPKEFGEAYMKAQVGGGDEWGANAYWVQDQAGQYHLYQPNKAGKPPKEMDFGPGRHPVPNTTYLDTGLGYTPMPTKGVGTPGAPVPKNVAGEAEQKAVGGDIADLRKSLPKVRASMKLLDGQWDLVDQSIDEATAMIDGGYLPRTGVIGAMGANIPGTPQYDLAQKLDTIKANIGFDKLQTMREASPTGGALGNVSDFENKLLQAIQGSLQQGQTPEQLKANLATVKQLLALLRQEKQRAFDETYGNLNPTVGAPQGGGGAADPLGIR